LWEEKAVGRHLKQRLHPNPALTEKKVAIRERMMARLREQAVGIESGGAPGEVRKNSLVTASTLRQRLKS
jgi:hypothetical protein